MTASESCELFGRPASFASAFAPPVSLDRHSWERSQVPGLLG